MKSASRAQRDGVRVNGGFAHPSPDVDGGVGAACAVRILVARSRATRAPSEVKLEVQHRASRGIELRRGVPVVAFAWTAVAFVRDARYARFF